MYFPDIRRSYLVVAAVAFLSMAGLAPAASAALVFAIGQNGSLLGSSLAVVEGASFSLEFYVLQTGSSNEVTSLGVNNADIDILAPAGISHDPVNGFQPGTGFSLFSSTLGNQQLLRVIVVGGNLSNPVPVTPVNPSLPNAVLLGTATFTVASPLNGPQSLTVSPETPLAVGFGNNVFDTRPVGLGSISLSSATAVPEPSAMILLLGCGAAGARRIRRSRILHRCRWMECPR